MLSNSRLYSCSGRRPRFLDSEMVVKVPLVLSKKVKLVRLRMNLSQKDQE